MISASCGARFRTCVGQVFAVIKVVGNVRVCCWWYWTLRRGCRTRDRRRRSCRRWLLTRRRCLIKSVIASIHNHLLLALRTLDGFAKQIVPGRELLPAMCTHNSNRHRPALLTRRQLPCGLYRLGNKQFSDSNRDDQHREHVTDDWSATS